MWRLWKWVMDTGWKSFEVHDRNMDVKGNSGEVSDGNEEFVIGCWRKGNLFKVAKNLAELCFSVLWKVELSSDKIRYLAEKVSKPSFKGAAWLLLIAYSKTWERR